MLRAYTVKAGDSPATIAVTFAGCPKCARDLVQANRHKPTVIYPNGYETFTTLAVGEKLALPDRWFDGTLDRMPSSYFASLPSVDGGVATAKHGLGSVGLGDVSTTSYFQQKAAAITQQMTMEGQDPTDIQGAVSAFADTANQLNQSLPSATAAINAAQSYILQNKTLGGAVDLVTGLGAALASGAPPMQLVSNFTGSMIGLTVTVGGLTAGVGAAIIGITTVALGLLQGLFSGPPPTTQICPCSGSGGCIGINASAAMPDYYVPGPAPYGANGSNCVVAYDPLWVAARIQPGSAAWRHFPSPTNAFDVITWYRAAAGGTLDSRVTSRPNIDMAGSTITWHPANSPQPIQYIFGEPSVGSAPVRYIDVVFPQFHHMQCEQAAGQRLPTSLGISDPAVAAAFLAFNAAFFQGLLCNWEYCLNGIKPPASDLQVLIHTLYMWNRAHDAGAGFDITPSTAQPWSANGTTCDGSAPPWYAAILAQDAGTQTPPDGCSYPYTSSSGRPSTCVLNAAGTLLHINTGAKKNFTLQGAGIQTPSGAPASSTGSTIAKGAVVVAAGGAAGLGIYAWLTKQTFQGAAKHLAKKLTGKDR